MKFFKTLLLAIIGFSFFITANASEIPPGIPAEDPYIQMGYLDVTLYGADNTGTKISTAAIKNALRDAQDYKLVCYFPSGTYLVDDSINCVIKVRPNPNYKSGADGGSGNRFISESDYPVSMVGAVAPRPVIKLVSGAKGYGDPANPLPVIWFRAQNRGNQHPETAGSNDPRHEQSNIAFNMVISNLIIDLGGNSGAEGIRFAGAQGSTVQDVTILAKGAYAGFHSCVGQGGGLYNIEVVDGEHGMVIDDGQQSKFPIIAGAIFKNQNKEVFKLDHLLTPMVVVGFYIEKDAGPINSGWPVNGLSLIDGVIKYTNPGNENIVLQDDSNLYMKNVYVHGKSILLGNQPGSSVLKKRKWNHVVECIRSDNNGTGLINGESETDMLKLSAESVRKAPSATSLREKHTWDPTEIIHVDMMKDPDFINVEDNDKYSVAGAPEPANGDDDLDDTRAIQWAIDNFRKVFIPNGKFLTNAPLLLNENTQLMGVGKAYTFIHASDTWKSGNEHVMIKTVADSEATTLVAFLNLSVDKYIHRDMVRIDWRTGRNSIIKDIRPTSNNGPVEDDKLFATLHINGATSGGRIYGWTGHCDGKISSNPEFRDILVDKSEQGLSFYGVNTERSYSDVQFEIRDSKNVNIYYFKSESGGPTGYGGTTHPSVPIRIRNSENILYTCTTGVLIMLEGNAIVEIEDCTNITLANIKPFFDITRNNKEWYLVKETVNGKTNYVRADPGRKLVYFSRE